jgi:DNA polymerase phi
MFAEKASSERKFLGFNLLAWAIGSAPLDLLPALFTPNFMRSLINQRTDLTRDLSAAANLPLEAIVSRAGKDAESASKLLEILVTSETSVHFDPVTNSKTLIGLVSNSPDDGKPALVAAISGYIVQPPIENISEDSDVHNARVVLANLLATMVARQVKKHNVIETSWTTNVAQTLASFAYLKSKQAKPSFSEESRTMFHDALIRSVNNLLPKSSSPGAWLASIVRYIHKAAKSSDHSLVLKADESIVESITASQKCLQELQKSTSPKAENKEVVEVLQLLFSLVLLEVYGGDADATDMLSELQTCYSSIQAEEAESQAFDLLVELLLSFLSKTSSLYRHISEIVFPAIASSMSEEGLESLLDILSKTETLAGQGELFASTDAEAEDDEDGSDISMDSDIELMSASEDDVDRESGANSDEDGEEDPELQQFNNLLAQTLKTAAPKVNGEADGQGSSDEDSDMDDDQMMALDPQLTKIFQERHRAGGGGDSGNKKKEKNKAKLQMTLFKSRVLDLLQIYVKKQYADPVVLKVVLPLLSLMRTTTSSELEHKAKTTLGSYVESCDRNKKYPRTPKIDELWTLLNEVHAEVQKEGSKPHDAACSRASLFLAKTLMTVDTAHIRKLVLQYGDTQIESIENGTNVQLLFFTEWSGWCAEWKKSRGKQEKLQKKSMGKKARTNGVEK